MLGSWRKPGWQRSSNAGAGSRKPLRVARSTSAPDLLEPYPEAHLLPPVASDPLPGGTNPKTQTCSSEPDGNSSCSSGLSRNRKLRQTSSARPGFAPRPKSSCRLRLSMRGTASQPPSFQKSDIGKLQDRSFSTAPDHKHEPLSVWRKCEILRAIYEVASLVFRHDPEWNEWRIVFELIKDIDRTSAATDWRSRSGDTHTSDSNCTPPGRKNAVFGVSMRNYGVGTGTKPSL